MMPIHEFITFASEAEITALWGGACILVALAALGMERRRMKRARMGKLGWMPWTGIFLTFAVLGGALLVVAIPSVLRG